MLPSLYLICEEIWLWSENLSEAYPWLKEGVGGREGNGWGGGGGGWGSLLSSKHNGRFRTRADVSRQKTLEMENNLKEIFGKF
jgi:hypothetical protein